MAKARGEKGPATEGVALKRTIKLVKMAINGQAGRGSSLMPFDCDLITILLAINGNSIPIKFVNDHQWQTYFKMPKNKSNKIRN